MCFFIWVYGIGNRLTTPSITLENQSRQLSRAFAGRILGTFFHVANELVATMRDMNLASMTLNKCVAKGDRIVEELGRDVLHFTNAAMTNAVSSLLGNHCIPCLKLFGQVGHAPIRAWRITITKFREVVPVLEAVLKESKEHSSSNGFSTCL